MEGGYDQTYIDIGAGAGLVVSSPAVTAEIAAVALLAARVEDGTRGGTESGVRRRIVDDAISAFDYTRPRHAFVWRTESDWGGGNREGGREEAKKRVAEW